MAEPAPKPVRFTGPGQYFFWMTGFVLAVAAIAFALRGPIENAFYANRAINGLILLVFVVAVIYCFRQVLSVSPAVGWVRKLATARNFDHMGKPPGLIAPMAVLLRETPGKLNVSASSAQSILDAVSARMDEAGEITRYLGRLLIFLGLLGTFWGLLQTVGSVGAAVSALSDATGGAEDVTKLMASLKEPIQGMGTAFSSSLFGLAGSLVIGFLDLQAGQAQNRFFMEVEDWVHSMSRVAGAAGLDPQSPAYMAALMEQAAENISHLEQVLRQSAVDQHSGNEAIRQEIKLLTKTIVGLSENGKS